MEDDEGMFCPVCSVKTGGGYTGGTCSPECARTKAIVEALDRLTLAIKYEVEPPTTTIEEAIDGANRWAARQLQ